MDIKQGKLAIRITYYNVNMENKSISTVLWVHTERYKGSPPKNAASKLKENSIVMELVKAG